MDYQLDRLIRENEVVERDAIHAAIVPLIAGENLYTGQRFKLKYGTTDTALNADYGEYLGIVSPFLDVSVIRPNQSFWGILKPGTVTGMRHHWQHPAFDSPIQTKNEHELWIRNW